MGSKSKKMCAAIVLFSMASPGFAVNLFVFNNQGALVEGRIEDGYSSEKMGFRFERREGPITVVSDGCRKDRAGTIECPLNATDPLTGLGPRKMVKGTAKIDGDELGVVVEHWRRKVVIRITGKSVAQ